MVAPSSRYTMDIYVSVIFTDYIFENTIYMVMC